MKLKLFEEFKGNPDLLQNVKDCFQDLIDDEIVIISDNDQLIEDYKEVVCLFCELPSEETVTSNFEEFFEEKEKTFHIKDKMESYLSLGDPRFFTLPQYGQQKRHLK